MVRSRTQAGEAPGALRQVQLSPESSAGMLMDACAFEKVQGRGAGGGG